MPRAGRRLFRFHRRSAVRRRHCMSGSRRPRSTAANDPACHRMFRTGSRRWSGRTGSFARPMRSCARRRLILRRGGARPPVQAMIAFIDDHREVHGVEPICKVLPIAPSTYHAHVAERTDPKKLSTRAKQDMALAPQIARVFAENFEVYCVRKVWRPCSARALTSRHRGPRARHGVAGRDPRQARADHDQRQGGAVRIGPRQSPVPRAHPNALRVSDFTTSTWTVCLPSKPYAAVPPGVADLTLHDELRPRSIQTHAQAHTRPGSCIRVRHRQCPSRTMNGIKAAKPAAH